MSTRVLRTYARVAHTFHFCDKCCQQIYPGEMYEGRVEVIDRSPYNPKPFFTVFKHHIEPECDWPPDPDWDEKNDEFEDEPEPVPLPLPEAA